MKYIKTFEGLFDIFKKKKESKIDYNKIIKDPYWRPSEYNAYWKYLISWISTPIELIMKLSYEEKITSETGSEGGEYYFDGVWKTSFNLEKNQYAEYLTKQESASEGDKSKEFSFGHGQWFTLIERGSIVKATQEEIEFYDLHSETNKYNL